MTERDKNKKRYQVLIQQLDVIVLYENVLGLSKKEVENAVNRILDEMIEIRNFFKQNPLSDDDFT